jgi:hypothetical protein
VNRARLDASERLVLDLAHAALSAAAQRLAGSRYVSMSSRALSYLADGDVRSAAATLQQLAAERCQ